MVCARSIKWKLINIIHLFDEITIYVLLYKYLEKGRYLVKVVILAGVFGTRISEESHLKPKPMIEIGEMPILWHIMKIYLHYGFNDFVICLGYKGYSVKEFFSNYYMYGSDVTFNYKNGHDELQYHRNSVEQWSITLANTGLNTMTGGRLKRVQEYIGKEPFMLTYGDGVSDVNIHQLVQFHKNHKKFLTVTAVQPGGRFGSLNLDDEDNVTGFFEKPREDGNWVNGGFFVCEPEVFSYIDGDSIMLEKEPLERLAGEDQFRAFKHRGFWQSMDTLRDKQLLDSLWNDNTAPWKVW